MLNCCEHQWVEPVAMTLLNVCKERSPHARFPELLQMLCDLELAFGAIRIDLKKLADPVRQVDQIGGIHVAVPTKSSIAADELTSRSAPL